jgi:hypothetical protein
MPGRDGAVGAQEKTRADDEEAEGLCLDALKQTSTVPPMTPMQIHWCIIYWTRGDPVADLGKAHFDSEAGQRTFDWLLDEKLIEWSADEGKHKPTPRLEAFVEHLCRQPLPQQHWIVTQHQRKLK